MSEETQVERFLEDDSYQRSIVDTAHDKERIVRLGYRCRGARIRGQCWNRVPERDGQCSVCEDAQREYEEYHQQRDAAYMELRELGYSHGEIMEVLDV